MEWVPPESFDEYRLIKALGRGKMGQVWLAHDTVLDRLVAVKFIAAPSADEAIRQRFLTEARAAAHVQHPNVIAIYRFGEISLRPYLISEYIQGESLDRIARPVAWPRLLEIAIGLARGLAAAHGRGVLHRDLKPANAMVAETGEVKLLDFGLAKLLPHVGPPHRGTPPDREWMTVVPGSPGERMVTPRAKSARFVVPSDQSASTVDVMTGAGQNVPSSGIAPSLIVPPGEPLTMELRRLSAAIELSPSVTGTGAMIGTPAYMPPEAWRGEPATPRSDVYSLGALLYELGADAPPHRGGSPEAVRESVVTTNAPSLAIAAPGMDPGFAAIVDRCLRRDPTERFASGDAVREALEMLAAGGNARASERGEPLRRRLSPHSHWVVGVGAAFAVGLFTYTRIGGDRLAPPVSRVVAKNARPDALAQHSPTAARSPSLGPAGGCPVGMVPVPAGTFQMGSSRGEGDENEHPQHQVTLSAYCIDEMEVTVADYAACVADKGCSAAPLTPKFTNYSVKDAKRYGRFCNRDDRPKHPINCIDWNQAATYCTLQGKRLPTEAEWEYAARGHDGRVYPWGDEAPNETRLNMCGGDCGNLATRETNSGIPVTSGWDTTPVGSYPEGRSPFGALDMAGNVAEWTADWYALYPAQAETNPRGPDSGTSRVTRGGRFRLWRNFYTSRVAGRNWPDPEDRDIDLGFRCACWR